MTKQDWLEHFLEMCENNWHSMHCYYSLRSNLSPLIYDERDNWREAIHVMAVHGFNLEYSNSGSLYYFTWIEE